LVAPNVWGRCGSGGTVGLKCLLAFRYFDSWVGHPGRNGHRSAYRALAASCRSRRLPATARSRCRGRSPEGPRSAAPSTPASTGLSCNVAGRSFTSDRSFKSTKRPNWERTSDDEYEALRACAPENSPRSGDGKRRRDVHQVTRQRCPTNRVGNGVIQVEAETVRHAAIHVDALLL
jgi:hypothetical protein